MSWSRPVSASSPRPSTDAAQRPTAAEVYARLMQAATPPTAHQTLVMPAFDVPTQPTSPPGGGVGSEGAAVFTGLNYPF